MLLYCVAKEGSTGTSNDPGIPGIHIEGVRESCMGAEKRKWVSLQDALVFEEPSCGVIDKSLGDSTVLMGEVRDEDPTLRRYSLNG